MKKITVRLSTLMEILTQMKHDNVDFVEMDLVGDAVLLVVFQLVRRVEDLQDVLLGQVQQL